MTEYERWLSVPLDDPDLTEELKSIQGKTEEIEDRFYRNLEFGTAGLRGVLGAGTNRMNVYTVRKATQGLANYLNKHGDNCSVAIAYDSRIKSDVFAGECAKVLAASGVKAYIYPQLMPTPALSFAVRYLKCDAGINITASHNPSQYNGYKAYGSDGCQIALEMADQVLAEINSLDILAGVKSMDFDQAVKDGMIEYIQDEVTDAFLASVKDQSVMGDTGGDLRLVYTPLNGAGKMCVTRILNMIGIRDITIVPEQSEPDGNFPTCPYPNPESRQALEKGIALCQTVKPDLLLATDPDCDRVGIAVEEDGEYVLLSGNEVGVLLLDFVARKRLEKGIMPKDPVAVTTIVSTDMTACVAEEYGIELRKVLTGFKYIGDQIGNLEEEGHGERFIFGFEESYGYLSGGHVRDKDAVNASMLICEMALDYKRAGKSLVDAMGDLYKKHGYFLNNVLNFTFEGEDGMKQMAAIMDGLRHNAPAEIAGYKVVGSSDYKESLRRDGDKTTPIDLPKSNVLEYRLDNSCKLMVRPSGTEPKIKVYLSAKGPDHPAAEAIMEKLKTAGKALLGL